MVRACIARLAYRSVLLDSRKELITGEMHAMNVVWHIPPSASESSWVNLESRYGMCFSFAASVSMTRLNAKRLLLMCFVSAACFPVTSDLEMSSLPARSTNVIDVVCPQSCMSYFAVIRKIRCALSSNEEQHTCTYVFSSARSCLGLKQLRK
jgi:hypothetical protein